jgi:N6-adenosine-specific RNA methylase IME4
MTWDGLSPPYATIVADPPWPYDANPLGYQRSHGIRKFIPYSEMPVDHIKAMPVADLATPAAHLYLWTTQRFLWTARDVADAWGFKVGPVLIWCKEPMGLGGGPAFTPTTEFALFCRARMGPLIKAAREIAGLGRGDLHRLLRDDKPTGIVYRWEEDACLPTPLDWAKLRSVLPSLAELPDLADNPRRTDTTWWKWKRGGHSAKPPAFIDLVERVSPFPYVELFARQPRLGWDSWGRGFEHLGKVAP